MSCIVFRLYGSNFIWKMEPRWDARLAAIPKSPRIHSAAVVSPPEITMHSLCWSFRMFHSKLFSYSIHCMVTGRIHEWIFYNRHYEFRNTWFNYVDLHSGHVRKKESARIQSEFVFDTALPFAALFYDVRKPLSTHLNRPPAAHWTTEYWRSFSPISTLLCERMAEGISTVAVEPGGNSTTRRRSHKIRCPPFLKSKSPSAVIAHHPCQSLGVSGLQSGQGCKWWWERRMPWKGTWVLDARFSSRSYTWHGTCEAREPTFSPRLCYIGSDWWGWCREHTHI